MRATAASHGNKQQQGAISPQPSIAAHGHHIPAFGAICAVAGIPVESCIRLLLFVVARDLMSAATRLSLVGPLQSAGLLSSLHSSVTQMLSADAEAAEACQIDPILDILQGSHDRLYTRLFNS